MTSAMVEVFDSRGSTHKARILLDTCASANFITESLVKKLNLEKTKTSLYISALNNLQTTANFLVKITIKSMYSNFRDLTLFSVPKITDLCPQEYISKEKLDIPTNLQLADPKFYEPNSIDILLGTGPTLSLFCNNKLKIGEAIDDLYLFKTKLGWVVGGGIKSDGSLRKSKCMISDLKFDLENFWKIEEVDYDKSAITNTEQCEKHFR